MKFKIGDLVRRITYPETIGKIIGLTDSEVFIACFWGGHTTHAINIDAVELIPSSEKYENDTITKTVELDIIKNLTDVTTTRSLKINYSNKRNKKNDRYESSEKNIKNKKPAWIVSAIERKEHYTQNIPKWMIDAYGPRRAKLEISNNRQINNKKREMILCAINDGNIRRENNVCLIKYPHFIWCGKKVYFT